MILLAGGRPWATGSSAGEAAVPTVTVSLTGRDLAALATALGLLGLAATAALFATRGFVRQGLGAVVVIAGAGVMIDSWLARGRAADDLQAAMPGTELTATITGWPWLAIVGGLALAIAGVITAARSRSWPTMSRRYDAPAATKSGPERHPEQRDEQRDKRRDEQRTGSPLDPEAAWRALDRGEDPTAAG